MTKRELLYEHFPICIDGEDRVSAKKRSGKRLNVLGVRFWYTGIRVKDLEESIKFYKEALGFRVLFRAKMVHHEGTFVQMRTPTGRQTLELNYYPETSKFYEEYCNGSELDHIGLYVSKVREQYKRLVKLGCEPAVEPFTQGSWILAFVKDPNGIWLELIGREEKKKKKRAKDHIPLRL